MDSLTKNDLITPQNIQNTPNAQKQNLINMNFSNNPPPRYTLALQITPTKTPI